MGVRLTHVILCRPLAHDRGFLWASMASSPQKGLSPQLLPFSSSMNRRSEDSHNCLRHRLRERPPIFKGPLLDLFLPIRRVLRLRRLPRIYRLYGLPKLGRKIAHLHHLTSLRNHLRRRGAGISEEAESWCTLCFCQAGRVRGVVLKLLGTPLVRASYQGWAFGVSVNPFFLYCS